MYTFYLVRHGQCDVNLFADAINRIVGGRHDSPLTENGKNQASLLGNWLKEQKIDFHNIYSSTAQRTKNTAQIACIQNNFSASDIQYLNELLERNLGNLEGVYQNKIPIEEIQSFVENPWEYRPLNGESNKDTGERMKKCLEKIIKDANKGNTIGLFTHGQAINSLLKTLFTEEELNKYEYSLSIKNTSVTKLQYDEATGVWSGSVENLK
jgi:probable phosphoglycerate mutase